MADRARRKEKKRLKRQQKQKIIRKYSSITALQKIASNGGVLECWVNDQWEEQGMASLFVLGHTEGGRNAFSAFLIDVWCVGLKDAWGKAEYGRAEFMEQILKPSAQRMGMGKVDAPEARRLVAGGVRFSRQNGFRLPAGWEKWASIFGGLGDIANADLTGFTKDGKLLYMGTGDFIRQNLIACTPEEFFSHPDHTWIAPPDDLPVSWADVDEDDELWDEGDTDGEDDEEEGLDDEEAEATLREVLGTTTHAVREWCATHGIEPHPRLEDAAAILLLNALGQGLPDNNASRETMIEQALEMEPLETREDLRAAIHQLGTCMESYKTPAEAFKSLGISTH